MPTRKPLSIFNEIIGPVMRGCSSSHVAAALRIGRILRDMLGASPGKVTVTMDIKEALAASYEGQGSAMGFAGGLLGYAPESPFLVSAQEDAAEAGMDITYTIEDVPTSHPNTYLIEGVSKDRKEHVTLEAVSLGGGAIEIRTVCDVPVSLAGDAYTTLLFCTPLPEEAIDKARTLAHDAFQCTLAHGLSVSLLVLLSHKPLATAVVNALKKAFSPHRHITFSPVMPVMTSPDIHLPFTTAKEMLAIQGAFDRSLATLACEYEAARSGKTTQEIHAMMCSIADITHEAIQEGLQGTSYEDRILPPQAPLARNMSKLDFLGGGMQRTIAYVSAVMDAKSAMKVIVAAPTAGACGTLPGVVWSAAHELGKTKDQVAEALLAAGIIGVFIAGQATLAGEEGGCQAECGSAGAMAAAALVHMFGGSAREAVNAASIALQSILGLVCDTVGNRVEVPCMSRNIMAAVNAMAASGMAMAGFHHVIPLDETIQTMGQISVTMPVELRCTGLGGLSRTPTGIALYKLFNKE